MPSEKSEQVYMTLKEDILRLGPNNKLMSIRKMMQDYKTSQLLIDRAITRLRQEGIIYKRPEGLYTSTEEICADTVYGLISSSWPSFSRNEQLTHLKKCAEEKNIQILPLPCHFNNSIRSVKIPEGLSALLVSPPAPLSVEDVFFLKSIHIPVLIINHEFGGDFQINYISASYYECGMMAAEYLIRRGHRKLALFFSQPHVELQNKRAAGFIRAAHLLNVEVEVIDAEVESGEVASKKANSVLTRYLTKCKPDFTGLFALCDYTAKIAVCALERHGVKVPDEISVLGSEGLDDSEFFLPPLTAVGIDYHEYMTTILSVLDDLIKNPGKLVQYTFPQIIKERSSVISRYD